MSTAAFKVHVLSIELDGDRARARFRCYPNASAGDRCVTRSFVIRMLAADGDLAPGCSPAALARLVREAGLEPWPETPDEARRLHAPVIDRLATSTRVVSENADDSYDLEVELPDARFVDGLSVGQVFNTYASDVWFDDPTNPLASTEDRERWRVAQLVAIEEGRQQGQAELERESRGVVAWLSLAEAAGMLEVAAGKEERVADRLAKLIGKSDDPMEAAAAIVRYLMSSNDVEEVFVSDAEIRTSLVGWLQETAQGHRA